MNDKFMSSKGFSEAEVVTTHVFGKNNSNIDIQTLYTRAANLELSSDFSSAFRLYLAAADAFLHISRSELLSPILHTRCKAHAQKALDRAEKIKKASEKPGARVEVSIVPIDWFGQGLFSFPDITQTKCTGADRETMLHSLQVIDYLWCPLPFLG